MIPLAPAPAFAAAFPFPGTAGQGKKAAPAPRAGRHSFRAAARRKARLRRAADALGQLPAEREATHFLLESFFDPADLIEAAVRAHGAPCDVLRCSTLSFSKRNVNTLARLLDEGFVRELVLLGSDWMQKANAAVWAYAAEELVERRGQVLASARCHCKVNTLAFADGARLTFEGSGNLSSCRTIEQVMVARDAGLHDFHARWIDERVRDDAQQESPDGEDGAAEAPAEAPAAARTAAPAPAAAAPAPLHDGRAARARLPGDEAAPRRRGVPRLARVCAQPRAAVERVGRPAVEVRPGRRPVLPPAVRRQGQAPDGAPRDAAADAVRPGRRGGRPAHGAGRARQRGEAGGLVPAAEGGAHQPRGGQAL